MSSDVFLGPVAEFFIRYWSMICRPTEDIATASRVHCIVFFIYAMLAPSRTYTLLHFCAILELPRMAECSVVVVV